MENWPIGRRNSKANDRLSFLMYSPTLEEFRKLANQGN